jgi:hypothetical protein
MQFRRLLHHAAVDSYVGMGRRWIDFLLRCLARIRRKLRGWLVPAPRRLLMLTWCEMTGVGSMGEPGVWAGRVGWERSSSICFALKLYSASIVQGCLLIS